MLREPAWVRWRTTDTLENWIDYWTTGVSTHDASMGAVTGNRHECHFINHRETFMLTRRYPRNRLQLIPYFLALYGVKQRGGLSQIPTSGLERILNEIFFVGTYCLRISSYSWHIRRFAITVGLACHRAASTTRPPRARPESHRFKPGSRRSGRRVLFCAPARCRTLRLP